MPLDAGGSTVGLLRLAPRAERNGAGNVAEIGELRLSGGYAEAAEIEHRHTAVERAGIQPCARQPVKIVHQTENAHRYAQQNAGEAHKRAGELFRRAERNVGADLVHGLGELAVNVEHRVGRREADLDARLRRGDGGAALDGKNDLDVVAGIDAPAGHEPVDARTHGHRADVGRDDQVQKAEIRPAAGALFPQPLFHAGDLYAVRERADSVAPAAEDIRLDAVIGGERIEQAALPPVVHMSGISVCHEGVSFYGCRMGPFRVRSMDTIHLLYNII